MFIKIVIILLLLIVVASLLGGRGTQSVGGRVKPGVRKLMFRVAAVLLAIGVVVVTLHLSGCSRSNEPAFHSTDISGAKFARLSALAALTDHNGRRLASADFVGPHARNPGSLPPRGAGVGLGLPGADFAGKAVVVFFGYAQCPDICPTTLVTLQETMRLLGPAADRVQVLFVTLDPERDTQEVLAAYVPWFDSRFLGLYGDVANTREVAREFRVTYSKVQGKSALDYSLDHSATGYAYDPQGRLRLLIRYGEAPERIAADLNKLLAEN
ncbi:MAG: SCO family protein [Rhodocyclaceae bacterium]|nr:SCO family protein [Rhodocyclaceae bacterium]